MAFALNRSAAVNKFLNVRHSLPVRMVIGGLAWVFTLIVTGEPALAGESLHRLWRRDQFRKGLRRLSFYARRGWPRLNLSRDMVFVFCSDLTLPQLAAMRRFLMRRRGAHAPGLVAGDLAYVSAMEVIQAADTPAFAPALARFTADADAILAAIADTPADLPILPAEKDSATFALDQAAAALADFADCLARGGYPWFVLSGTLLGIVREGGFLPHDYDIDAGVMADAVDIPALVATLNADPRFHCNDLEDQTTFERDPTGRMQVIRRPVFLKVSHQGGVHIDVFVHYRDPGVIWHASSLFRWDNSDFDLAPYTLTGTPVLGPADADRYLTENYGAWRIPVTEFNSALDTTNQHVVRNPLSVAIFLRRIWMAARANPAGAAALMRALERGGFVVAGHDGRRRFDPGVFGAQG
jgi:hypothetical protein